jgi:hypothetical protein
LKPVLVRRYRTPVLLEERARLVALTSKVLYRQSVGAVMRTFRIEEFTRRLPFESVVMLPIGPNCGLLATVMES